MSFALRSARMKGDFPSLLHGLEQRALSEIKEGAEEDEVEDKANKSETNKDLRRNIRYFERRQAKVDEDLCTRLAPVEAEGQSIIKGASEAQFQKMVSNLDKYYAALKEDGHVERLRLEGRFFHYHNVTMSLYEYLFRHPDLQHISLKKSKGLDRKFAQYLCHALFHHPSIVSVDLTNSDATGDVGAGLAIVARRSKTLREIRLGGTHGGDAMGLFFGTTLQAGAPALQVLDLSRTDMTDLGAAGLAVGASSSAVLTELYLSGNKITRLGGITIADQFLESTTNKLAKLSLKNNLVHSHGALRFAKYLESKSCHLVELDLTNNEIGPKGGAALAEAAKNNSTLTILILKNNFVGEAATHFADAILSPQCGLEVLDLDNNDVTDNGGVKIGKALGGNKKLKALRLAENGALTDATAVAIGESLRSHPTLHILALNGNSIRDDGCIAIARALAVNQSLEELLLQDNEIKDKGAQILGEVLVNSNSTLVVLDVSDNPISEAVTNGVLAQADKKKGLVVADEGTEEVNENLQNFGVVFEEAPLSPFWGRLGVFIAILVAYGGLASHIKVVQGQYANGYYVYAGLVAFFAAAPVIYITLFLTEPEALDDEFENTIEGADDQNEVKVDENEEAKVDKAKGFAYGEKIKLMLITLCVSRVPYEAIRSYQRGLTSDVQDSVSLAMAVLQNLPLALINLQILLTNPTYLASITRSDYAQTVANRLANDPNVAGPVTTDMINAQISSDQFNAWVVIASDVFAVYSIANVTATLFEHRGITNFTRRHHIDGSFLAHVCSILTFWYHLFHFVGRLLTLVVGSIAFYPVYAAALFVFLVLERAAVHYITRSERSWTFAIITVFVGTNAWDTLVGARLVHIMEILEGAIVAGIIFTDVKNIPYPVLSQDHLALLQYNVQSLPGLAVLIMADLVCATVLHFVFMEWTREYDHTGVLARWAKYAADNAENWYDGSQIASNQGHEAVSAIVAVGDKKTDV